MAKSSHFDVASLSMRFAAVSLPGLSPPGFMTSDIPIRIPSRVRNSSSPSCIPCRPEPVAVSHSLTEVKTTFAVIASMIRISIRRSRNLHNGMYYVQKCEGDIIITLKKVLNLSFKRCF